MIYVLFILYYSEVPQNTGGKQETGTCSFVLTEAVVGHTGACAPATWGCAQPVQVCLSIISADYRLQVRSVKSLESEHHSVDICI